MQVNQALSSAPPSRDNPVKLKPLHPAAKERLDAFLQILVGALFTTAPLAVAWLRALVKMDDPVLIALPWLLLVVGIESIILALRRLLRLRRVGAVDAFFHPEAAGSEHGCRLSIRYIPRQASSAEPHASVVLREALFGDHLSRNAREHSAVWFDEKDVGLVAGEAIVRDYQFNLPDAERQLVLRARGKLSWVFKFRVRTGRADAWHEFVLPLEVVPADQVQPVSAPERAELPEYAVVLMERKLSRLFAIRDALGAIHPFLNTEQLHAAIAQVPATVLRSTSRNGVEMARRRLEAAGAVVEVRVGSQVVPALLPHNLPLAAAGRDLENAALPLPTVTTSPNGEY